VRLTPEGYEELARRCQHPERVFYLATPPDAVPDVVRMMAQYGLTQGARVVIEKPFGFDAASAQELNRVLRTAFDESQIFRIDHYLGKETVQNFLIFRFANGVFERVWNRDAVHHIQVTIAETIGIEGRASFYEKVGALRDIVQNHALQMLALLAMEAPASFQPEAIRDEKTKLLRAIRPIDPSRVVRGQYTAGVVEGEKVPGYREEPDVAPDSTTETYLALQLSIDNWRWADVPVFLRTGKRMAVRATEVEIAFKDAPIEYLMGPAMQLMHPNHLIYHVSPDEAIIFRFLGKVPGPLMDARQVDMTFCYDQGFMVQPAEAYERLLHDVMHGDQTLFVRQDAIERSWEIVQPVLDNPPPLRFYEAGSWGPPEADQLIAPDIWHLR
jgi:glucose-6-phosphate 1-dehydrogenase